MKKVYVAPQMVKYQVRQTQHLLQGSNSMAIDITGNATVDADAVESKTNGVYFGSVWEE